MYVLTYVNIHLNIVTRYGKIVWKVLKIVLKAIQDAKMPGASSWIGVLPLAEFGFALNKGEFTDALSLRYGRPLKGLLAMYPCGQKYNVTHALNCKKGGFATKHHNNLTDFEVDILSKIVDDVETKPKLQPVTGEIIERLSGNASKPDIRARGVWRAGQNAFLMVG